MEHHSEASPQPKKTTKTSRILSICLDPKCKQPRYRFHIRSDGHAACDQEKRIPCCCSKPECIDTKRKTPHMQRFLFKLDEESRVETVTYLFQLALQNSKEFHPKFLGWMDQHHPGLVGQAKARFFERVADFANSVLEVDGPAPAEPKLSKCEDTGMFETNSVARVKRAYEFHASLQAPLAREVHKSVLQKAVEKFYEKRRLKSEAIDWETRPKFPQTCHEFVVDEDLFKDDMARVRNNPPISQPTISKSYIKHDWVASFKWNMSSYNNEGPTLAKEFRNPCKHVSVCDQLSEMNKDGRFSQDFDDGKTFNRWYGFTKRETMDANIRMLVEKTKDNIWRCSTRLYRQQCKTQRVFQNGRQRHKKAELAKLAETEARAAAEAKALAESKAKALAASKSMALTVKQAKISEWFKVKDAAPDFSNKANDPAETKLKKRKHTWSNPFNQTQKVQKSKSKSLVPQLDFGSFLSVTEPELPTSVQKAPKNPYDSQEDMIIIDERQSHSEVNSDLVILEPGCSCPKCHIVLTQPLFSRWFDIPGECEIMESFFKTFYFNENFCELKSLSPEQDTLLMRIASTFERLKLYVPDPNICGLAQANVTCEQVDNFWEIINQAREVLYTGWQNSQVASCLIASTVHDIQKRSNPHQIFNYRKVVYNSIRRSKVHILVLLLKSILGPLREKCCNLPRNSIKIKVGEESAYLEFGGSEAQLHNDPIKSHHEIEQIMASEVSRRREAILKQDFAVRMPGEYLRQLTHRFNDKVCLVAPNFKGNLKRGTVLAVASLNKEKQPKNSKTVAHFSKEVSDAQIEKDTIGTSALSMQSIEEADQCFHVVRDHFFKQFGEHWGSKLPAALEIMAGHGRIVPHILKYFHKVEIIEASGPAVRYAHRFLKDHKKDVVITHALVQDVQYVDRAYQYQCVIGLWCLCYLNFKEIQGMLDAIKLVLSVGGCYVAFEPVVEDGEKGGCFSTQQQMFQRTSTFYDDLFKERFRVLHQAVVPESEDDESEYSGYVIYVLSRELQNLV